MWKSLALNTCLDYDRASLPLLTWISSLRGDSRLENPVQGSTSQQAWSMTDRKLEQQENLQKSLNHWTTVFRNYYRRCQYCSLFLLPITRWNNLQIRGLPAETTGLNSNIQYWNSCLWSWRISRLHCQLYIYYLTMCQINFEQNLWTFRPFEKKFMNYMMLNLILQIT